VRRKKPNANLSSPLLTPYSLRFRAVLLDEMVFPEFFNLEKQKRREVIPPSFFVVR
jgi:hypothetical protein